MLYLYKVDIKTTKFIYTHLRIKKKIDDFVIFVNNGYHEN